MQAGRICIGIAFAAISLRAQSDLGGISGTVSDSTGGAVPAATVEAVQVGTNLTRVTKTADSGLYAITGLPSGTYVIRFDHFGFTGQVVEGIRIYAGQTYSLDARLGVSGQSERVQVTGKAAEVDQTSASTYGRIERVQLDNLPLNGRNWAALLTQMPGAIDPGTSDQRGIRFAGHGRDDNNFELDGVDAGGISNQPQKAAVRLSVPASSIAEFRVDSALFNAQAGTGTGAQIMLVSSSGTNEVHGALFEFLRNDVFDARNPFASTRPPFRLNQFGGDLGGPMRKNSTWFYAAYEGYRQALGQVVSGFVPSALFREKALQLSPAIAPLLNAYPLGTAAQPKHPNIDVFSGLSPQRADENSGMIRIDHRFTDRLNGFLRVNADEVVTDAPLGNLRDRQVTDIRPMNGVASLTEVFSPALLNEFRFGFNQVASRTVNEAALPYTLNVAGFSPLSSSRTREEDDTSGALIDDVSLAHGPHLIRAGVQIRRVFTNPASSADGTLSYTSVGNFAANKLNGATATDVLPLKRLRKTQVFSFIQDEYRIRPELTLTAGLRYSFFNVFHEAGGRAAPFDFGTCGGFCPPGSEFSHPRLNDIDPRLALVWAPKRLGGKTIVRTGFGVYHGDGQLEDQNLPASNDVARYALNARSFPGLAYPIDPALAGVSGVLSPREQDRNRPDEYSAQWGLSVQQQLPAGIFGSVGYIGNKGTHLQTITYDNIPDPVTGISPHPDYSQVEYRTNSSNSTFHAMVLSARRSFRSGWLLSANYMLSHAINDGSLGGGEADIMAPQNPFCRACDKASSAMDARHFVAANWVYQLPFGRGKLARGWSVSGVLTARSGLPVNVTITRAASATPGGYTVMQRPDLVPGVSLIPPGGQTPAQWLNPAAFVMPADGVFGNAGRDIARGPSMSQLDLGVARRFAVTERTFFEFRGEAFNVFNRAQYGQPIGNVTVPAQFGIIQSTINTGPVGTGTPRQLQFMLRVRF